LVHAFRRRRERRVDGPKYHRWDKNSTKTRDTRVNKGVRGRYFSPSKKEKDPNLINKEEGVNRSA